jgi:hypothetical protein
MSHTNENDPLLNPNESSSSSTSINQTDYDGYSNILFQIEQLQLLFKQNNARYNHDNTLTGLYKVLLLKKLYLDEVIFKADRPKASRNIDTLAELDNFNQKKEAPEKSKLQKAMSPIESTREWLIYLNTFRLDIVLWSRLLLEAIAAQSAWADRPFTSLTSKADIINGWTSVGFYVANVLITSTQALGHKLAQSGDVTNIEGYDFNVNSIETKATTFLGLHKYKFINDFIWAPVNAFYFINQTVATCRNNPIIGDGICTALFIVDALVSIYAQYESEQKFNKLQLQLADDYLKQLQLKNKDRELRNADDEKEEKLKKHLMLEGFEDKVIDKLVEIALALKGAENEKSLLLNLTVDNIYLAILAINTQKKKTHWEQQKGIYLTLASALAMSILLCADVFTNAALNLLLIGSIFGVVAKLCLVVYNYYENISDPNISEKELRFRDYEFRRQIAQQLSFITIFLLMSLVIMPHIAGPSLVVSWVLISLCLASSCIINQYLQNSIDKHPDNPANKVITDESDESDDTTFNPLIPKKDKNV